MWLVLVLNLMGSSSWSFTFHFPNAELKGYVPSILAQELQYLKIKKKIKK